MSELHLLVYYNDTVLLAYVSATLYFHHVVLYFFCIFKCTRRCFIIKYKRILHNGAFRVPIEKCQKSNLVLFGL